MVVLLAWDKGKYTGRLLVLFPCIYVLQHQLIHLFQSSPVLPSLLPMVASGQFKISIFIFIQWAYQLHSRFCFPSLGLSLLCVASL
jgi:hypothetical protein